VPDLRIPRYLHNIACTMIRRTLWSAVGARTDRSMLMRVVYRCLALIPRDVVFTWCDWLPRISNRKPSKLVRQLRFPTPSNGYYGYYAHWYDELEDIQFEGHLFPAPKDYDAYLTFKFGNYDELPPIEQRIGHASTRYKLLPPEEMQRLMNKVSPQCEEGS